MSGNDAQEAQPEQPAKSGGLVGKLGAGLGLFVIVIAGQLTALFAAKQLMPGVFGGGGQADAAVAEAAAESSEPPLYLPLDPPLVVSLEDGPSIRFLQVSVEVMARDAEVIEAVKEHNPVIRNNLLMLLGGQQLGELNGREGKQVLRDQALAEVQTVLTEQTGKPGIENLYFTSFVVQ